MLTKVIKTLKLIRVPQPSLSVQVLAAQLTTARSTVLTTFSCFLVLIDTIIEDNMEVNMSEEVDGDPFNFVQSRKPSENKKL